MFSRSQYLVDRPKSLASRRWGTPKKKTLLVAANGERMPVMGMATLTAGANGVTRWIHALVSPAITEDMLVSCNDLINLEIIPRNFPNVRIQNCRSIKEFKDILIGEFPGVLSNELNPEPMKRNPDS